jgi:hypothetical protein
MYVYVNLPKDNAYKFSPEKIFHPPRLDIFASGTTRRGCKGNTRAALAKPRLRVVDTLYDTLLVALKPLGL